MIEVAQTGGDVIHGTRRKMESAALPSDRHAPSLALIRIGCVELEHHALERSSVIDCRDANVLRLPACERMGRDRGRSFAIVSEIDVLAFRRGDRPVVIGNAEAQLPGVGQWIVQWQLPDVIVRSAAIGHCEQALAIRRNTHVIDARRPLKEFLRLAALAGNPMNVCLRTVVPALLARMVVLHSEVDPIAIRRKRIGGATRSESIQGSVDHGDLSGPEIYETQLLRHSPKGKASEQPFAIRMKPKGSGRPYRLGQLDLLAGFHVEQLYDTRPEIRCGHIGDALPVRRPTRPDVPSLSLGDNSHGPALCWQRGDGALVRYCKRFAIRRNVRIERAGRDRCPAADRFGRRMGDR